MDEPVGNQNRDDDLKNVWEVDHDSRELQFGQIASDAFPVKQSSSGQVLLLRRLKLEWLNMAAEYPTRRYGWPSWWPFLWSMTNWTEEELKAELHDFIYWIDALREEFLAKFDLFLHTQFLTSSERRKHWPSPHLSHDQIIQGTRTSHSLFFPEVSAGVLQQWLWLIMAKRFGEFASRSHNLFFFRADRSIGASRARETSLVRFDIDYATPTAHAYPINETDVDDLSRVDTIREFGLTLGSADDAHASVDVPNVETQTSEESHPTEGGANYVD